MGKKANIKALVKNIAKDAVEYICDYIEYDYKIIIDETIKRVFYDNYKPKYYHRKKSLYKAYKILNDGKRIDVYFGPDYMGNMHRVGDEYIYKYMFKKGWHGGAHSPGYIEGEWTPMRWRTPHPDAIFSGAVPPGTKPFSHWSKMRPEQTRTNPYDEVVDILDKYDNNKETYDGVYKIDERIRQGLELALENYGII